MQHNQPIIHTEATPINRTQTGFVLSRWLLVLFVIGLLAFVAITFAPAYLDQGRLIEAVEVSLPENDGQDLSDAEFQQLANNTKREILLRLKDLQITEADIRVERNYQKKLVVIVRYETRRPLIANLDYLAMFNYRSDR